MNRAPSPPGRRPLSAPPFSPGCSRRPWKTASIPPPWRVWPTWNMPSPTCGSSTCATIRRSRSASGARWAAHTTPLPWRASSTSWPMPPAGTLWSSGWPCLGTTPGRGGCWRRRRKRRAGAETFPRAAAAALPITSPSAATWPKWPKFQSTTEAAR